MLVRQRLVVVMVLAMAASRADAASVCIGDCDGDGRVTVDELIHGIDAILEPHVQVVGEPQPCPALEDSAGMITISQIIKAVNNALEGCPPVLSIVQPSDGLLVLAGTVAAQIDLPAGVAPGSVAVTLDGADVTAGLSISGTQASGNLAGVTAGEHMLAVQAAVSGEVVDTAVQFEAVALNDPDECEVLNNAECLLPYPSSRFLVADTTTPTGFRVQIPGRGLPQPNGPRVLPDPINRLDGFSPTVQILMHFPQGVDLDRSDASRLLAPGCCGQPAGPPWINTRTYDGRSLAADSPSVLIDANTGERVLHWLENDAHAAGNLPRQTLVMRPGASLLPGHRYIVAMRDLHTTDGSAVVAEPAFAALRDKRPTNIAAIESRRPTMEVIFSILAGDGVARGDLVLAFDFTVSSEQQLTRSMLSMRDQAYAWLAEVELNPNQVTFSVGNVKDHDCSAPGAVVWREVAGTFKSPLFLTKDPNQDGVGFLALDEHDLPLQTGFTNANFTIEIPCSILQPSGPPPHPIVLGHGLFDSGSLIASSVPPLVGAVVPWTYIAGATDWRGLSSFDLTWVVTQIIGVGENQLNNFPGLPDRLRQGMLNTLVLARMMKDGLFNRDTEVFRTPSGSPVFPGPDAEMYYYGISLGGIMGTWFAALTPDIERFDLDVPAINFSCLLQRSTQFGEFQTLLAGLGLTDPMQVLLGLQLLHETWVAGEPAGYARHITTDPLPGTGDPKHVLMTAAWLDKQVSNQCTEAEVRTLNLPNLVPASIQRQLQGIADDEGPLDSAYVMFNTGAFDLFTPADQPFIPPLANLIPSPVCDPHEDRPAIPDGIKMLAKFLQPGGRVENFCRGMCDAGQPDEIAGGASKPCNPLAP